MDEIRVALFGTGGFAANYPEAFKNPKRENVRLVAAVDPYAADFGIRVDEVLGKGGALEALYDLKREGKIGFTGIASHYYDVLLRAAKDPRVDVLQGSGNILERGMLDRIRSEEAFKGKGFILNKVYAAGLLIGPFSVAELIGGILGYPFSSALLGVGTFEQA